MLQVNLIIIYISHKIFIKSDNIYIYILYIYIYIYIYINVAIDEGKDRNET